MQIENDIVFSLCSVLRRQFTILLVGYFVLGPSDLYKLVKEIGKFIQNIRTLGTDLSTTFESNMESQLELEELRKAQRDLTDAFSFRRSINVDDTEAFATTTTTPRAEEVAGAGATAAVASEAAAAASGTPKKKKRVRVKKKIQPEVPAPSEITSAAEPATSNIPDLEMPSTGDPFVGDTASSMTKEEEEEINKEFEKYVNMGSESEKNGKMEMASLSPEEETASQTRFQQQMSSDWNKQIMDNEDKLSPLAKVMEMLAVLEKEKISKSKLLEEEYRKRAEMDQEYYEKQRKILEDAAAEVQKDVYKIP